MHWASKRVPRRLRFRFWLTRTLRWLVPEARCLSFPVAVRRNRFLVALCVFILCDMAVVVFPMKLQEFLQSRSQRAAREIRIEDFSEIVQLFKGLFRGYPQIGRF